MTDGLLHLLEHIEAYGSELKKYRLRFRETERKGKRTGTDRIRRVGEVNEGGGGLLLSKQSQKHTGGGVGLGQHGYG